MPDRVPSPRIKRCPQCKYSGKPMFRGVVYGAQITERLYYRAVQFRCIWCGCVWSEVRRPGPKET